MSRTSPVKGCLEGPRGAAQIGDDVRIVGPPPAR